jgi:ribose/xylose/arabinose/galactoside ABC-type transport system permease subunit
MGEFMMLGAYFFYTANVMWKMPMWLSFIVTLAGLSALRGIALLMTEGYSIPIATDSPFVAI